MAKKRTKAGFYRTGINIAIVGNPFGICKLYPRGWYIWAHCIPVQGPFKTLAIATACHAMLPHPVRKYCQVVSLHHGLSPYHTRKPWRKVLPNKRSKGFSRYKWLNYYQQLCHPYGYHFSWHFAHWGFTIQRSLNY